MSIKAWIALAVASFLLIGCSNFFNRGGASSSSGGTGTISLSLVQASSKTVAASSSDILASIANLAIAIVDSNNKTVAGSTVSYSTGSNPTYYGIVPGTYTIEVSAYNASGSLIAQGSAASQTVTAGGTLNCSVSLSASLTQTGKGGFSLTVQWPSQSASTYNPLPYIRARLDSATASDFYAGSGTNDGTNYSVSLAQSGLLSGQHILYLYFQSSASATTSYGPIMEVVNIWDGVTSTAWLNSSGTASSALTLTTNSFSSSDANLSDLTAGGTNLSPAFNTSTATYTQSAGFTNSTFNFTAKTDLGSQTLSYTWNGTAGIWAGINSSYSYSASGLSLNSGTNTLVITVMAPDQATTKIYTVTVNCGTAAVSISNPSTTYQGIGIAGTATIAQNDPFSLTSTNNTLLNSGSNWSWTIGNTATPQSINGSLLLSPDESNIMVGSYTIGASVVNNGITYTDSFLLTVNKRSSLSSGGTLALLAGSGTGANGNSDGQGSSALFKNPLIVTSDGNNLYVADSDNSRLVMITQAGVVTTILTGYDIRGMVIIGGYLYFTVYLPYPNGFVGRVSLNSPSTTETLLVAGLGYPTSITTDGSCLYLSETGENVIRMISIATDTMTTFAGTNGSSGLHDGTGTSSVLFKSPWGLVCDGSNLYLCDEGNNAIRQIALGSIIVTTLYHDSTSSFWPWVAATDGEYLYVTDSGARAIQEIAIGTGVMTTFKSLNAASSPRGITILGNAVYYVDLGLEGIYSIK